MPDPLSLSPVATPPAYGCIVKEARVPTLEDEPKWVRSELEVFFVPMHLSFGTRKMRKKCPPLPTWT